MMMMRMMHRVHLIGLDKRSVLLRSVPDRPFLHGNPAAPFPTDRTRPTGKAPSRRTDAVDVSVAKHRRYTNYTRAEEFPFS